MHMCKRAPLSLQLHIEMPFQRGASTATHTLYGTVICFVHSVSTSCGLLLFLACAGHGLALPNYDCMPSMRMACTQRG